MGISRQELNWRAIFTQNGLDLKPFRLIMTCSSVLYKTNSLVQPGYWFYKLNFTERNIGIQWFTYMPATLRYYYFSGNYL